MKGKNREAYNISNCESIISIRRMAEILAEAGGVQVIIGTPTDVDKKAFNPMENSSLKAGKLEALGWRGLFSAETGFANTVRIIRELIEGEDR